MEKEGISIFVPDLPGFGENPMPKESWSVDDYVEWVRNFADKNIVGTFFILGHSFGGRVAIKFAVRYPEKLDGLILAGVPALKTKANPKEFTAKVLAKLSRKFFFLPLLPWYPLLRRLFYKYILRKTDYLYLGGVMKETFIKVIEEDLSIYLPQIRTKTLILWGDKDDFVPFSIAHLIKEKILNSELTVFPNVKHGPHREIPEELAKTILKWLVK